MFMGTLQAKGVQSLGDALILSFQPVSSSITISSSLLVPVLFLSPALSSVIPPLYHVYPHPRFPFPFLFLRWDSFSQKDFFF